MDTPVAKYIAMSQPEVAHPVRLASAYVPVVHRILREIDDRERHDARRKIRLVASAA